MKVFASSFASNMNKQGMGNRSVGAKGTGPVGPTDRQGTIFRSTSTSFQSTDPKVKAQSLREYADQTRTYIREHKDDPTFDLDTATSMWREANQADKDANDADPQSTN